jgi:uncharacterized membrane protein
LDNLNSEVAVLWKMIFYQKFKNDAQRESVKTTIKQADMKLKHILKNFNFASRIESIQNKLVTDTKVMSNTFSGFY